MKKIYLIIIFIFLSVYCFGQNATYIKGKNWEGYAFPKEFSIYGYMLEPNRYTLSCEEIKEAEEIVKSSQIYLIGSKGNKKKAKLSRYYRQYIGYKSIDNHILVRVLFFRKSNDIKSRLSEDVVEIHDGGDDYFKVTVDLTEKKIFDIKQNGFG